MHTTSVRPLSTGSAIALYVGALLGPSLLLLPGLATGIAGPASILAWFGLLGLSGALAWVFTALGVHIPTGGTAAYTGAALGRLAGRAVAWCFVTGAVLGAPVVCLIGGWYVAALFGLGRTGAVLAAGVLLIAVVVMTLGGTRFGTAVQLALVATLIVIAVLATAGSLPHGRAANWTPFAPHGWVAVGSAASSVMLAFVGWEAIAPLTGRLADPHRQLPRVTTAAFAITSLAYLGVAVATISVLGATPGPAPLAGLLRVAVGAAGPALAAITALALTLAATNAYLSGAGLVVAGLSGASGTGRRLQVGVGGVGVLLLAGVASGALDVRELVALPTALFMTVYLGCTVAATRLLTGVVRIAAGCATIVVLILLGFTGQALLAPVAVIVLTLAAGARRRSVDAADPVDHRGTGQAGQPGEREQHPVTA